MRQPPKRPTVKTRGKAPRGRRRRADALARRLACLLVRERRHVQIGARIRGLIDQTLLSARDEASYKLLGHEALRALGRAETLEELDRIVMALKQRAKIARRRCAPIESTALPSIVAGSGNATDHVDMPHRKPVYVRESFYSEDILPPDVGVAPPPEELGDPERLSEPVSADHDDDDDDDDFDDEAE